MKRITATFLSNGYLADDFENENLLINGEDKALEIKAIFPAEYDGYNKSAYIKAGDGGTDYKELTHEVVLTFTSNTIITNGDDFAFTNGDEITITGCSTAENNKTATVTTVSGKTMTFPAGTFTEGTESVTVKLTNGTLTYTAVSNCILTLENEHMKNGTLQIGFEATNETKTVRFEKLKLMVDSFVNLGDSAAPVNYTVTVNVGTVNTLEAGQSAVVENAGTEKDVVLNFSIPKGDKPTSAEIQTAIAESIETNSANDTDYVPITVATAVKKLSFANLKAVLKAYFDTLYNKYVHPNHTGDVTSSGDGATTIKSLSGEAVNGKNELDSDISVDIALGSYGGLIKGFSSIFRNILGNSNTLPNIIADIGAETISYYDLPTVKEKIDGKAEIEHTHTTANIADFPQNTSADSGKVLTAGATAGSLSWTDGVKEINEADVDSITTEGIYKIVSSSNVNGHRYMLVADWASSGLYYYTQYHFLVANTSSGAFEPGIKMRYKDAYGAAWQEIDFVDTNLTGLLSNLLTSYKGNLVGAINEIVMGSHTHTNKSVLDGFIEVNEADVDKITLAGLYMVSYTSMYHNGRYPMFVANYYMASSSKQCIQYRFRPSTSGGSNMTSNNLQMRNCYTNTPSINDTTHDAWSQYVSLVDSVQLTAATTPTIKTSITSNTLVLTNNQEARLITLGDMATLILNMPSTVGELYRSYFAFKSGATPTSLTYSATPIVFKGDDCYADGSFVPAANVTYEVDLKNIGSSDAPIIIALVSGREV